MNGHGKQAYELYQFHHRQSRIGGKGAITATAHKLACLVYRMLKHGKEYLKQSMEASERKIKDQLERSLRRKAALLGYELVAKPAAEAGQVALGGRSPAARPPVSPADIVATIYHCLGVSRELELHDNLRRPFQLVPWGDVMGSVLA